jgi:hypothetical protein
VRTPRPPKARLREQDLSRWKLIADFQARLATAEDGAPQGTFADPRRRLHRQDYLSLLLFGLFNAVVDSMRGLCAATALGRVQREVCTQRVSLGSFSEAQAVVAPDLWAAMRALSEASRPGGTKEISQPLRCTAQQEI